MIILMCFHSDYYVVYTMYWPEMKKVYDRMYPETNWIEG